MQAKLEEKKNAAQLLVYKIAQRDDKIKGLFHNVNSVLSLSLA